MPTNIFSDVRYYVSLTLRSEYREQLDTVLDAAGATAVTVDDPSLTHFITNSLPNDDALEALPEDTTAHLVTPTWVERSRILDAPQPPEYYSPDPAQLFSGVTATATDLSASDRELMYASITALGGQWRSALTRDVTHVFALVPGSQKYETAMHFKAQTDMLVLVPHWHDDTIRLGVRGLPTAEYEWPEPAVFKGDWSVKKEGAAPGDLPKPYRITGEKKPFFDTALVQGNDLPVTRAPPRNLWNSLRILLATSLQLSQSQREAHEEDIRREGGVVVPLDLTKQGSELVDEEVSKVEEADIYVTTYRSGPAFVKAYRNNKTIGTLSWLWYCRAIGTISHPTDQLIHFPIPRKPIEGFSKHSITITNYTGKHRDYLKKLILLMGAEFTASMSPKNTVVVAAYHSGTKTEKATSWSIPVVNHTWLEDCFTQWRALTPAQERYITFPPRMDFSELISTRPTGGKVILEPAELDALAQEGFDGTPEPEGERKPRSRKENRPLVGAAASAGSSPRGAEQVAKADTPGEVSLGEFLETDIQVGDARKQPGDEMDVDEQVQEHEPEKPRSKGSSPRKYQSKAKTLRRRGAARQGEEDEEDEEDRPSTSRAVERQKRTSMSTRLPLTSDSDSDVEMDADSPLKGKTNKAAVRSNHTSTKGKGSSKKVASPESSGDEDVMDIDTPVKAKSKPKAKTVQPKTGPPKAARKRPKPDSSSEDEQPTGEPSHAPRSAAKSSRSAIPESVAPESPAAKPKPARAPRKAVAVVVPTVAAAYADAGAGASSAKKALGRKQSVRAAARESPASPGKRGRITREKEDANLGTPEKEGPGPVAAAATPGTVQRTPSRRAAASKATRRLHEEIMPDVVNFQKQLKNGAVKGAWESDVREGASEKSKGKKRASDGDAGALSVDEEQRPEKKRQKTGAVKEGKGKTQGKQAGKGAREEEEDEGETSDPSEARSRAKPASKGKSATSRSQEVKVMTTQITISDEVTKFLKKMGVQMTTKPAECTHLVARNLVRTEKFLCAIARAPHILNEKWLLASYSAKELLPEDTFVLKDPANEDKFGFRLADALQRAKANAGKLFAGHTFYVTPHVPVDSKLLKNVVAACGGALSTQTPTARVLAGHAERHVVSCPEDRSIWRPVAQAGHQVYNQELILTSALKQEVEWEKEAYLLATDE